MMLNFELLCHWIDWNCVSLPCRKDKWFRIKSPIYILMLVRKEEKLLFYYKIKAKKKN